MNSVFFQSNKVRTTFACIISTHERDFVLRSVVFIIDTSKNTFVEILYIQNDIIIIWSRNLRRYFSMNNFVIRNNSNHRYLRVKKYCKYRNRNKLKINKKLSD